jgi:hypothetical protein
MVEIFQIAVQYKIYLKWDFCYENKTSGNPTRERYLLKSGRDHRIVVHGIVRHVHGHGVVHRHGGCLLSGLADGHGSGLESIERIRALFLKVYLHYSPITQFSQIRSMQ